MAWIRDATVDLIMKDATQEQHKRLDVASKRLAEMVSKQADAAASTGPADGWQLMMKRALVLRRMLLVMKKSQRQGRNRQSPREEKVD